MMGVSWIVDDRVAEANRLHEILGSRLNRFSGDVGVVLTDDVAACRRWPTGIITRKNTRTVNDYFLAGGIPRAATFHGWDEKLNDYFLAVPWGGQCLMRHKGGAVSGDPRRVLEIVNTKKDGDHFLLFDGVDGVRTVRAFGINYKVIAAAEAHGAGPFRPISVSKKMKRGNHGVSFIDYHYIENDKLVGMCEYDISTSWEGFDPHFIARNVERYVRNETVAEKHMSEIRCIAELKGIDLEVKYDSAMVLGDSVVSAPFPYEIWWTEMGFTNKRRFADPKKMARFVRSL